MLGEELGEEAQLSKAADIGTKLDIHWLGKEPVDPRQPQDASHMPPEVEIEIPTPTRKLRTSRFRLVK